MQTTEIILLAVFVATVVVGGIVKFILHQRLRDIEGMSDVFIRDSKKGKYITKL